MENLKVIRTSKQESLTREVELFKDEKQLAQNYINSEGFIFEEADLILSLIHISEPTRPY